LRLVRLGLILLMLGALVALMPAAAPRQAGLLAASPFCNQPHPPPVCDPDWEPDSGPPPAAPTDVVQLGKTPTSFTIGWTDNSIDEQKFVVSVNFFGPWREVPPHAGTGPMTYTFDGFDPYRGFGGRDPVLGYPFQVFVAALNAAGQGAARPTEVVLGSCVWQYTQGSWPPDCWRPYSDNSPYNQALSDNAPVASNSAAIVTYLRNCIPVLRTVSSPDACQEPQTKPKERTPNYFEAHRKGDWGEPTYYSQPHSPSQREYVLHCTYRSIPEFSGGTECPIENKHIWLSPGAQVEGDNGSPETTDPAKIYDGPDAHLTVVDQAGGWEYDLWKVHTGTVPDPGQGRLGELRFAWGGRVKLDGSGQAFDGRLEGEPPPDPGWGQGTAARVGDLAGRLRAEEFAAAIDREKRGERGLVYHALFLTINCDNGTTVPPARPDVSGGYPCARFKSVPKPEEKNPDNPWNKNAPPMGTRFRLALTPEQIDEFAKPPWGMPPWERVLVRTFAKYGAFMADTGAGGALFSLEAEAGNQYQLFRGEPEPKPWSELCGDPARLDPWLRIACTNGSADGPWPQSTEDPAVLIGNWRDNPKDPDLWQYLQVVHPCVTRQQMVGGYCTLNEWSR
jgi:hypothetical protein